MFCPNCGTESEKGGYCRVCGSLIATRTEQPKPQEKPPVQETPPVQPPVQKTPPVQAEPVKPQPAPVQAEPVKPQPAPVQPKPAYQAPPVQTQVYVQAPKEITEDQLPEKYRPLSAWAYFGLQLLFAIPIVGFIFLIVFSCSDGNINRRSFARSYWCALLILAVVAVVVAIIVAMAGMTLRAMF